MSTTPKNNDGLNDADLAALFDAETSTSQFPTPAAELDALILQYAKDAQLENAKPVPTETFAQKYRPVIATAAVLLIGIGLTPLGTQVSVSVSESDQVTASTQSTTVASAPMNATAKQSTSYSKAQVDTDTVNTPTTALASAPSRVIATSDALTITNYAEKNNDSSAGVNSMAGAGLDTDADSDVDVDSGAKNESDIFENFVQEETEAEADVETNNVLSSIMTPSAIQPELSFESEQSTTLTNNLSVEFQSEDSDAVGPATDDRLVLPSTTASAQVTPNGLFPNATRESSRVLNSKKSNIAQYAKTDSNELKQTDATQISVEKSTLEASKKSRVSPDNYRSSPLLWVIEIKHLFNEKNKDKALEELIAFRKAFPNNSNERLLPEDLRSIRID